MREIRLLRSNGRELETGPRQTLHGHEAGNGGYSQGDAYRHRASSRPYQINLRRIDGHAKIIDVITKEERPAA